MSESLAVSDWQKTAMKMWASRPWILNLLALYGLDWDSPTQYQPPRNEKSKGILIRVPPELHIALKELAHINSMSLQDLVVRCCLTEISNIVKKSTTKKKPASSKKA